MTTAENITDHRPLGYWLAAIPPLLRTRMRTALAGSDVSRRDWRVLARLHEGSATLADLESAHPPRRRHPAWGARRPLGSVLADLADRGWATVDDGRWSLTDAGRTAHDELHETVAATRAGVTEGISDDDWATTMATLQRVAENLGFDPDAPVERRGRGHRGHGHNHPHGHGRFAGHPRPDRMPHPRRPETTD